MSTRTRPGPGARRPGGARPPSSHPGPRIQRREPWSPRSIAILVGLVVLFAALVYAAFGLESDTGPSVDELAGSPDVTGDALPVLADGAADPAIGVPAPLVAGAAFDGTATTIGDDTELVVFLAAWCSYCREELPGLVEWMDRGGLPDEVELTAVVTGLDDAAPNWPPTAWLEREGYTGDVLVDDAAGSVADAYGMSGTPFWVALRDGEVVARSAGLLGVDALDQLAEQLAG